MLGIGENARKAQLLASNTEARRAYDLSGEYVCDRRVHEASVPGARDLLTDADGTIGITTRVDNVEWHRPRIIRQVARWNPETRSAWTSMRWALTTRL